MTEKVVTLPCIRIERDPSDAAWREAEMLVAQWIIELWVEMPDWLKRMPIEKDTKRLVELIAKKITPSSNE